MAAASLSRRSECSQTSGTPSDLYYAFGVAPDLPILTLAVAVMLVGGVAACYLRARRATQVDRLPAFRSE